MHSLFSRWLRHQIRLIKPVLCRLEVEASRSAQDQLGALYARVLRDVVAYPEAEGWSADKACWAVRRQDAEPCGAVLYLHGGGYVAGSLAYARLFGGVLAASSGFRVFCLGYALAPEHPYPAALEDAMAAYRYLLDQGCRPEEIAIVGESAGGGMAFGLMHRLRQQQMPLPACIVALSPWTDLSLSGDSVRYNARHDVNLSRGQLEHFIECLAPHDLAAPDVSPALGSFEGFPPALVFAGGDEMLLDDARAVLRGYVATGGRCRLIIGKGMWHAYPLYPTRESGEAIKGINAFLHQSITQPKEAGF